MKVLPHPGQVEWRLVHWACSCGLEDFSPLNYLKKPLHENESSSPNSTGTVFVPGSTVRGCWVHGPQSPWLLGGFPVPGFLIGGCWFHGLCSWFPWTWFPVTRSLLLSFWFLGWWSQVGGWTVGGLVTIHPMDCEPWQLSKEQLNLAEC